MITVSNYNAGGAYSSGGSSSSGISSLQEGPGINIQNPNGPTATIASTGVISLESGNDITVVDNLDGSWTVDSTPTAPWELPNNSNSNTIILDSNAVTPFYNPIVTTGKQMIAATGTINTEFLVMTTQSSTTAGFQVSNGQVSMGAGGTSSIPSGYVNVSSGVINMLSPTKIEMDGGIDLSAGAESILLSGSQSMDIISPIIQIDAGSSGQIITSGTMSLNKVATCSATMPANTDSSTKIPSTAWVQSAINLAVLNPNKTYTVELFGGSGTVYTQVPSNCEFCDVMVIGAGGLCGASAAATGGGTYYGGSGGGGAVCSALKLAVLPGQYFSFNYDANGNVTVALSIYYSQTSQMDTICYIPRAGTGTGQNNGTNASATGGGQKGTGQVASNCSCDSQCGTWIIKDGQDGANAPTLNTIPTSGGRPGLRQYIAGDNGMGQRDAVSGSWGRPTSFITFYLK